MQDIANQLLDAFSKAKRVTKSYIFVENAPIKIDISKGQITSANESKACLKHGRPLGSKDKNSWKKR